jgi:hypothetical protein
MFENTLDLNEKISIIEHADLADAKILDANYFQLINETSDTEEQKQFIILRTNAQLRIKELTH